LLDPIGRTAAHARVKRLALATYAALPHLNDDDRLLIEPLAALGVTAEPAVWDAIDVRWEEYAGVMVRSCWDYHRRLDEFLAWVARLERSQVPLVNSAALLRWNSHKAYLRDLATAGVPTVPTHWLTSSERASLAELLQSEAWDAAVVKPAVSASAHDTWRTSPRTAARDQPRLDALLAQGDVMVQEYFGEVASPGEWSLVFFGDRFSHAARKRPAAGDFRVQWEYGGSAEAMVPPRHLIEEAERVLEAVDGTTVYARVDGVERGGRLILTELELIEPHLFLGWEPDAAARLAGTLADALG
jgi:glutathione synthase/RimK-type ligase-like ATP-grasp enzyme